MGKSIQSKKRMRKKWKRLALKFRGIKEPENRQIKLNKDKMHKGATPVKWKDVVVFAGLKIKCSKIK